MFFFSMRSSGIFIISIFLIFVIHDQYKYITSEQAIINARLTTLRSPISGYVHFNDRIAIGSLFKANETLFEVTNPFFCNSEIYAQCNNIENLADGLKIEIRKNNIQIQKYKRDYARSKRLAAIGGVPEMDLEDIATSLDILHSTVKSQSRQLRNLYRRLSEIKKQVQLQKKAVISSKYQGVVWTMLIKEGEYVKANEDIIQMVNPEDITVDAFFNEKYASRITPNIEVMVKDISKNTTSTGKIIFIRGGSGRVMYNSVVENPPETLSRRLMAVRIQTQINDDYNHSEFYGIGRSMKVIIKR
ncbi:MAG: HlyD family efflux transporter periplasmic adaptor subunit [Candidatus Aureabacteria bacterium]|nr:HlyD family efflux transporter periplasmic adaptor subunit [Candidatus Auribacterota bacterium]